MSQTSLSSAPPVEQVKPRPRMLGHVIRDGEQLWTITEGCVMVFAGTFEWMMRESVRLTELELGRPLDFYEGRYAGPGETRSVSQQKRHDLKSPSERKACDERRAKWAPEPETNDA